MHRKHKYGINPPQLLFRDDMAVMQATLPSKPNQNTSVPMMRGVWVAYAVVSWCYFGVSCAGYWAFGNNVMSNVIFSIGHPKWMVAMADLFVTVHVIGSYQVSPNSVLSANPKLLDFICVAWHMPQNTTHILNGCAWTIVKTQGSTEPSVWRYAAVHAA